MPEPPSFYREGARVVSLRKIFVGSVLFMASVQALSADTLMRGADAEPQVLAEINAIRVRAGCPALVVNKALTAAAQGHADAMALQDFFNHTGKDGRRFGYRVRAQKYTYWLVAENIAAGQTSARQAVQGWMDSASHRRNILNCSLQETGIAMTYQADDAPLAGQTKGYKHYWVQVFATP
jgi:serralysin